MLSSKPSKKTKTSQNTNPFASKQGEVTNKRTRSQFSLAEFQFSFDRSPLKDARKAMRKANKAYDAALGHSSQPEMNTGSNSSSDSSYVPATGQEHSLCVDAEPDIDDELLLSPKKSSDRAYMKRASSPSFDDAPQVGPAPSKRVKITNGRSFSGPLDAFFAPRLKTVIGSTKAQKSQTEDPSQEVPALCLPNTCPESPKTPKGDKEIPHIDFSLHTPSPRKRGFSIGLGSARSSPLKSGRSFSEGTLQHEEEEQQCGQTRENDQQQQEPRVVNDEMPKTSFSAPETPSPVLPMDVDTIPAAPEDPPDSTPTIIVPGVSTSVGNSPNEETEAETIQPRDDTSKASIIRNPSLFQTPSKSRIESFTRNGHPTGQSRLSAFFPSSSSTPVHEPFLNSSGKERQENGESTSISASTRKSGIPVPVSTRLQNESVSGEETTTSSVSQLPTATKPTSQGGRKAKSFSMQPMNPRTTRATTLRLKQLQKNATGRQASPSKVNIVSSVGPSHPQDYVRPTTCPTEAPFKTQQSKVNETPSESDKQPAKLRKPFVLTKPSSLSPEKRQSTSSKSSYIAPLPKPDFFPPPVMDPDVRARTHSALDNLTFALDKLTVPPPPKPAGPTSEETTRRPSTSMGFIRDISTSSSSNPRPLSRTDKHIRHFLPPPPVPRFGSKPPMHFSLGVPGSRKPFPNLGVRGPFERPFPRIKASQKTSLETVQGSPVKGAATGSMDTDDAIDSADDPDFTTQTGPSHALTMSNTPTLRAGADVSNSDIIVNEKSPDQQNGGLKKISTLNSSRRASMAFSTLSRTLSEQELLTPKEPSPKEKKRSVSGSQSVPSSRLLRSSTTRSSGDAQTPPNAIEQSSEAGPSTAPAALSNGHSDVSKLSGAYVKKSCSNRSKMPGSLDTLRKCTIFVDVRTDEGEDAGALFVDMLRGLGAKILARVGQSCTHIVFKNGLGSTVTRYKIFDEPRPFVVGIGWVVECVEKRERVDESRFKVDIDGYNISGMGKRRRSILPKHLALLNSPGRFEDDDIEQSQRDVNVSMSSSEADSSTEHSPLAGNGIPALAAPLETARRRSILLTGSMKPMAR